MGMIPEWVTETSEGALLRIYVQPKASRTSVCGLHDGRLKLKVQAPPVEGAANKAIQKFLAKKLKVSKGSVVLISGEKSRQKSILIKKLSIPEIIKKITAE